MFKIDTYQVDTNTHSCRIQKVTRIDGGTISVKYSVDLNEFFVSQIFNR